MYNNKDRIKNTYDSMIQEEGSAQHCIKCGKCETLCPQGIKIRDMLVLADEALKKVL